MPTKKTPKNVIAAPKYVALVDLWSDVDQRAYPAATLLYGDEFPAEVLAAWLEQGIIAAAAAQEVTDGGKE